MSEIPTMLHTPIGRLRAVGLAEGCSYLLLLGIAMPLKHFAGLPQAVFVVGWVHGVLFITLCLAIALAVVQAKLPIKWAILALVAAVLPFGPFVIDSKLRAFDPGAEPTPASP